MIKKILLILLLFFPLLSFAQNTDRRVDNIKVKKKSKLIGDVTIGSSSFDASAILGITSTTKGLLIPRMTTTQRDNISSPTTSLMIYNITDNEFQFFETTWQAIGAAGNTIYSADDNLTGNRVVTMGANNLTFSGNLTTFKGIDATSSNFGLKVQNNVGTELLNVRNDGLISVTGRIDQTGLGNSTYFGKDAGLNDDLTTNNNTAIGFEALNSNITGAQNVAVGYQALKVNTTSFNTAIGYQALLTVTTGNQNTAVGLSALKLNTGSANTAVGSGALATNSSANNNTALGKSALKLNTTGANNTAVGLDALEFNILGGSNVAIGGGALNLSTSSFNTAVGQSALKNSTGTKNIALGQLSGDNITTGQRNIIIGQNIDAPSATANEQLVIGNLIFGIELDGTGTTISTGNIGIGIPTPNAKLAVNGGIVSNTYNFVADVQADDDYEIDIPDITSLTTGLMVTFTANTANTGAATLEITSVGDLDAILKLHDQALITGDIEAGQILVCVFDGTNWQMISQLAQ